MATTADGVTVTISTALADEARRLAEERGEDPRATLETLIEEGVRMARVPGILFADGPIGRRARIAGTGLDVFEVIHPYRQAGRDFDEMRSAYHWLTDNQLRAAVAYYETYPADIDARLDAEERFDIEAFWAEHPRSKPTAS